MKLPAIKLPQTTALIFLIGAVVFGLTVFQFLSLPTKNQKIKTAENELVILRQKNETLSGILSEVKTLESNAEVARTALPVSDEVPALIMQLEQIAKQSGVAVQHLGFGEDKVAEESVDAVRSVSLTMVVTGSYEALQTFFKNLEETLRVINVTNFRFSPAQQAEQGNALSITLGARAFYLVEALEISTEEPLILDTSSKDYVDLIKKVKQLR